MAFCKNCGSKLEDGAAFCPNCGTPVDGDAGQGAEKKTSPNLDFSEKISEAMNMTDRTNEFDALDAADHKLMGILAYLGILILIPLFAAKNSRFVRFHVNQGLLLILLGIVGSLAGKIIGILGTVVSIFCLVLTVIGIVHVVQGQAKELPLIGRITLIK